jgi:ligand-binding SRPBCC domain-containing protein
MKIYYLQQEQLVHVDIARAWDFFSSAENLSVITPPELGFKIFTDVRGKDIYEGMIIEYKVSPLFGIPLHWKTEIAKVDKPHSFMDRQLKGPYQLWEHTHVFIEKENGTLVKDTVKYSLPFGLFGQLINAVIVRQKLRHIFSYRKEILDQIFKSHGKNTD